MATYASVMRARKIEREREGGRKIERERESECRKKTPSAACVSVGERGRPTASVSAVNRRSIFVCRHS